MADSATQGLVNDLRGDSAGATSERYMAPGREAARGLLSAPDNFNSGLSYGDQAMTKAIQSKHAQKYSLGERRLAQTMNSAGQDDYLKKLQVTADMAGQEHQMNLQKEILRQKEAQANKRARGAVVGQVLGITGAIVAGAYTGGAGAAAGYAAGNAAGNMIGGA